MSDYLAYCVLIGDIIYHTHHISLCGSEKTAKANYTRNLYLTASRAATHTSCNFNSFYKNSPFGCVCYSYLDNLLLENFITLFLFCWDVRRQMSLSLIIHQQVYNEYISATLVFRSFYLSSPLCVWAPSLESHQQVW